MATIKNRSQRKTSISENIEQLDTTDKSKIGQDSNETKTIMTNPNGSTISTRTVISHKNLSPARLIII